MAQPAGNTCTFFEELLGRAKHVVCDRDTEFTQ